jgi:hypothetical protein
LVAMVLVAGRSFVGAMGAPPFFWSGFVSVVYHIPTVLQGRILKKV